MENQHRLITGYRELTPEEVAAMNTVKREAEAVRQLCEEVKQLPGVDQRWAAIAVTDLQKGFMSLVRSIAKPTTF